MKNTSSVIRATCGLLFLLLFTSHANAFWMLRTVCPTNGEIGTGFYAGPALGTDGKIYGMSLDGAYNKGKIYVLDSNETVTTLFSFNGTNGYYPVSTLEVESNGAMYGSTYKGGATYGSSGYEGNGFGTLFRVTPDGGFTNLLSFNGTNGAYPWAPLIRGADGWLYGTTQGWVGGPTNAFGTVFKISTNGDFATIFSFNGTNGSIPFGRLLQWPDGALIGTTFAGGVSNLGTVFKLTTNGELTTLVSFVGTNGSGANAGLVAGDDGWYFGTTLDGGTNLTANTQGRFGFGTIFRITTNGGFQTLHCFEGVSLHNSPGGYYPQQLVKGADGFIYGTAREGGVPTHFKGGYGTIFCISTNGVVETLAAFNRVNGGQPTGDLLALPDGGFYGTMDGYSPSGLFHLGPAIGPMIQDVTINENYNNFGDYFDYYLDFKFKALAGVLYGIQTNATLDPAGWHTVNPSTSPFNGLVMGSSTPALLQTPSINEFRPMSEQDQLFYRVIVLPP